MINVYMDDMRPGPFNSFAGAEKGWEKWVVVRSVENVKQLLSLGIVNDLALDHDMGFNSEDGTENPDGTSLVRWMIETETWPEGNISVHSGNVYKAKNMKADIEAHKPNIKVEIKTDFW